MALSDADKKRAAKWWITQLFKKPKKAASAHYGDIKQAIEETDAWIDAAPAGGASNAAAFASAIHAGIKTKLTGGGIVVADALALLLAAVAQARAGALPGQ